MMSQRATCNKKQKQVNVLHPNANFNWQTPVIGRDIRNTLYLWLSQEHYTKNPTLPKRSLCVTRFFVRYLYHRLKFSFISLSLELTLRLEQPAII